MRVRPTLTERFWAKIDRRPDGCWRWRGALDTREPGHPKGTGGYGRFSVGGRRTMLAHRFAYELLVEPIPAGLTLDHLCRNTWCVNPSHLEPVTLAENTRRAGPFRQPRRAEACGHGHPWTPENTRTDGAGDRHCRACDADAHARRTSQRATVRVERFGHDPGPRSRRHLQAVLARS